MSNEPNIQPAQPNVPAMLAPPTAAQAPVETSVPPATIASEALPPVPPQPEQQNGPSTPEKKKQRFGNLRRKAEKKHFYAHDVYTRRFKHFRRLHLLSVLIGASIFLILCFGMWQLYNTVFSTIEDTEHLFLITEKRKTNTITFQVLEDVRASWDEKYSSTTAQFTQPLFNFPLEEEPFEGEDE